MAEKHSGFEALDDVDMDSHNVINLAAPVNDNDAARKVDVGEGGGIHAASHEVGGADLVDHDNLTNSPTNTGAQIDTAITASTNHIASDGSDHSKVTANETAIGLNTTHRGTDGTADHSQVATNKTHVDGDGADHADVASNTSARHTQNTDTALGSDCEAADHGVAATDQIINVCYGTGDPPTASDTTEGTLFVKYTA